MSLLIKGGEIVTGNEHYIGDIYCEHERITHIDRNIDAPAGAEVINASGKYVFPGFIDPHVHIYLPFMGTFSKDTYETASKAALVGGTTTLIEMVCPSRDMSAAEGFRLWQEQAAGKSACDYTYHMGVTRFDEENAKQLREIVAAGISSFKIFLAYKGAFGIDDAELYHTLKLAKELGVIVTAHCENETLVAERQKELLAAGKTETGQHHESRPPRVEAEGVHHLMTFAELTGAHVYIVHLSCDEALREALAARHRGVNVSIETLIQYLVLDKTDAERPEFEGAKFVMSPPLRDKSNQPVLWNGLSSGEIQTVATDHAPFDFKTQKPMGRDDFTKIPNGIPSLEDRVNLLFTHGVKTGKARSAHVRERREHERGEDVRIVPAQRRDPDRRGCRPGHLRSGISRQDFREDAVDECRLQRVRRLGHRRPAGRGHGARRSRGARREVCRHDRPRCQIFGMLERVPKRFVASGCAEQSGRSAHKPRWRAAPRPRRVHDCAARPAKPKQRAQPGRHAFAWYPGWIPVCASELQSGKTHSVHSDVPWKGRW